MPFCSPNGGPNKRPLNYTGLDHSNAKLVHYSDPQCTLKCLFYLQKRYLSTYSPPPICVTSFNTVPLLPWFFHHSWFLQLFRWALRSSWEWRRCPSTACCSSRPFWFWMITEVRAKARKKGNLLIFETYLNGHVIFIEYCLETILSGLVTFTRRHCKCERAFCLPYNYSVQPLLVVHWHWKREYTLIHYCVSFIEILAWLTCIILALLWAHFDSHHHVNPI